MDRHNNIFYLIDFNQGLFEFSRINIRDGTVGKPFKLTEQSFPENIQIYNGWLYFLAGKEAYHKLYRVPID